MTTFLPILKAIVDGVRDELTKEPEAAREIGAALSEVVGLLGIAPKVDELVPVEDVAVELGVQVRAIRSWAKDGKTELVGRPGKLNMRRSVFEQLRASPIAKRTKPAPKADPRADARAAIEETARRAAQLEQGRREIKEAQAAFERNRASRGLQ